ncbi:MAG TPA: transcription termination factor NusA [Planctomycetota bacterium]|jgi:N utilization substance protein A|nr:transcription termination factor NusA [Planctomycetota bacterium]
MNQGEFMRLVDMAARERNLDKKVIIDHIERALIQAAQKRFDAVGDFTLTIDRETGEIRAFEDEKPVELERLGRIVANVAKQVFVQALKESERDMLYDDFIAREHTITSGTVMREERGMIIVSLGGRAEAILPKEEQIPGEVYRPGAVIRAYLLTVGKKGQRVRLVLSRTHANFVRELFKAEIPEVADGLIEVKGIVREPGRRTKIAVATQDPRIDPVGSCVGMRGSRITKVTDELGGEKIDIIPWAEDPAQFIENSLKPARVLRISYDTFRDRARVVVSQDQLPLAIGKAGQNVRLSARLTRYKIDVMSEEAAAQARVKGAEELQKLIAAGLLEDFLREVFLDNHLDSMAVLAAQTPERLVEAFENHHVTLESASKLIAKAEELLTEEQKAERDQIIARRQQAEREAADEAARALVVDEAEALAAAQAALQAGEATPPTA